MKSVIGYCKFCGNSRMMEVPESYTQELVDEDATKKCDCDEAHHENAINAMINHTEYQLGEILKDREKIKEMSIRLIEPLARGTIDQYSIKFGAYALKMVRKTDKISTSLKYTEEEKRE